MTGKRLGYLRVSSLDQNTERQLESVALDKTFTDKASGKDVKRPQLVALIDYACDGATVLVHSMDRLARNLDDLRRLVQTRITWIDPTTHQPVALSITQTPAELPTDQSRVDFYATVTLNTIMQLPDQLKKQVQAVVGDAYYTRLEFVARVVDEGQLPFVGKMRKDANLKHLFTGPRTGKPGRPQLYDGKVSLHDHARWDALPWADECMVYTVVAYAVSLKRQVRVVAVVGPGSRSRRTEVLFSTSITMTVATIIALYRAWFSMEFPFRDAKQFAGLSECQSRQVEALHFHWNMALMAV